MRTKLVNPLTVAVALCLALMTYEAIRPMPDRSLRLTLIFHEQGGRSAASPWRNTQDILARWETGAETHGIDPSEIVAYEWSVHALHLPPAGSERLGRRWVAQTCRRLRTSWFGPSPPLC
jgi:hypothetical protein